MTALQERALRDLEAAMGQINKLLVVIIFFTPTLELKSQKANQATEQSVKLEHMSILA